MSLILFLLFCVLSGVFYRMGGTSKGTLWRDLGVSGTFCLAFGLLNFWTWWLCLVFFLMWGALSTYRYFLPKPVDYKWYHYALHGYFVALAAYPLYFAHVDWLPIVLRAFVTGALVSIWSTLISESTLEEWGRGFIILSTLPILWL